MSSALTEKGAGAGARARHPVRGGRATPERGGARRNVDYAKSANGSATVICIH